MVKEDTFVTILPFMVNDLHLSGNELMTYAIIHGFTMHGSEAWFTGSASYIAEWCGCSKRTVYNVLAKLEEKGVIERRDKEVNGVHLVDYRCKNFSTPMQKFQHPDENFSAPPDENFLHQNIEIDTIEEKKEQKREGRFTPPTLEEVSQYIKEMGYGLDPQEFIDANEQSGWKLKGGQPVKDWKARVRTFERYRRERGGRSRQTKQREATMYCQSTDTRPLPF